MKAPHLSRFSLDDSSGRKVHFTESTEIVDYLEPSRAFGREDLADPDAVGRFQRRVAAAPDRRQAGTCPMVFTLGNHGTLHLVRRSTQDSAGWESIALEKAFQSERGHTPKVQAFGLDWTEDDSLTLIAAVEETAESSRIFVADGLSSKESDWENLSWADWGVRRTPARIEGIQVSRGSDDAWIGILCGTDGPRGEAFLLRSNQAERTFAAAIRFETGFSLSEVFSFAVGRVSEEADGIHCLGRYPNQNLGLQTRALPEFDGDGEVVTTPPVRTRVCPPDAKVVSCGIRTEDGADLYIGGKGVHRIAAADFDLSATRARPVMEASVADGVKSLAVAEGPDGDASVWAVTAAGELCVVHRTGRAGAWSAPLVLRRGVAEVSPVAGNDRVVKSVIVVYQGGRASHLWADAGTGAWQETAITFADPAGWSRIPCFGTNFRVLTATRSPRPEAEVELRASVVSNLVVNGESFLVGPDLPVKVKTRADGSVSVFNRAATLTPASYRFAVDGVAQAIDVNPSAGVFERFQKVTAAELRAATVDGAPLLPESMRTGERQDQADAFVTALRQAARLAPAGNSGIPGISFVDRNAAFSTKIDAARVGDDFHLTVEPTARGMAVSTAPAPSRSGAGGWIAGVGETLADFFESAWGTIREGARYVFQKAGEAVQFLCEIGGKIKEFVVSTIEEIGKFFNNAWDTITRAAGKVWDYLKFLFDWEDVIVVRNIMTNSIRRGFRETRRNINESKDSISKSLDSVRDDIQTLARNLGVASYTKLPPLAKPEAGRSLAQAGGEKAEEAQSNSVMSWFTDKLGAFFSEIIKIEPPEDDDIAAPELPLSSLTGSMENTWQALKSDLAEVVGPEFDFGSLTLESLQKMLSVVGLRLAEGAIQVAEFVLIKLLEIAEGALSLIEKFLFSTVSFPFVEKIIEFFTGDKVSTAVRLVDVLALMAAIPATLVYKIVTGERPPQTLQTWIPGDNLLMAQSGSTDPAALNNAWKAIVALGKVFSNLVLLAYSVFTTTPIARAGAQAARATTYLSVKIADYVSACLLLVTNVFYEVTDATTPLALRILIPTVGAVQFLWAVGRINKKAAQVVGNQGYISQNQVYENLLTGGAVLCLFSTLAVVLKSTKLIAVGASSSHAAWADATTVLKSLSQAIVYYGTWKMQPKVLLAGGVAALLPIGTVIVQIAVSPRREPSAGGSMTLSPATS